MKSLTPTTTCCIAVLIGLTLSVASVRDARGQESRGQGAKKSMVKLPMTLEADQRTELRARVEGYVAIIHVDIGDRVKKDQILVTLQAPELQAEVRRQEQLVRQAEAHLNVAKGGVQIAHAKLRQAGSARDEKAAMRSLRVSERDRYLTLVRGGAVQREKLDEAEYGLRAVDAAMAKIEADVQAAQVDVEAARNAVEFAESGIEVAKAELARAKTQDQLREIQAPFAGLVTDRSVDVGQLVSPGNVAGKPLLVVEHVDVLRGVMTVPAEEAALINVGDEVSLTGFGDTQNMKSPQDTPLTVSRLSQSLDMKTRTMRVEIDLQNSYDEESGRYQFLSGQYGRASVNIK